MQKVRKQDDWQQFLAIWVACTIVVKYVFDKFYPHKDSIFLIFFFFQLIGPIYVNLDKKNQLTNIVLGMICPMTCLGSDPQIVKIA